MMEQRNAPSVLFDIAIVACCTTLTALGKLSPELFLAVLLPLVTGHIASKRAAAAAVIRDSAAPKNDDDDNGDGDGSALAPARIRRPSQNKKARPGVLRQILAGSACLAIFVAIGAALVSWYRAHYSV